MFLCTLRLPRASNSKDRRHQLFPRLGIARSASKQTLHALILWRGAKEDAASFFAGDWRWQSEISKDDDQLDLLLCYVDDDAQ